MRSEETARFMQRKQSNYGSQHAKDNKYGMIYSQLNYQQNALPQTRQLYLSLQEIDNRSSARRIVPIHQVSLFYSLKRFHVGRSIVDKCHAWARQLLRMWSIIERRAE